MVPRPKEISMTYPDGHMLSVMKLACCLRSYSQGIFWNKYKYGVIYVVAYNKRRIESNGE
jgi:hypothetical protein